MFVTATSSDQTLIRNPGILYTSPAETAQLTFKPRPGRNGTATITVTVTDLVSLQKITRTFDIVVTAVDDPPNIGPATSLQFNGNNFVRVPAFGSAIPSDEITVEFWQKADAAASQNAIVLNPDNTANRLSIQAPSANGAVVWDFGNSAGNGRLTYTPPVSIVGSWQHFAFVAAAAATT